MAPSIVRIARGDPSGEAIRLSARGWAIERQSGVLFRRTELTGALPRPERGGDISELARLLNLHEGEWPVVLGWLVGALHPTAPKPLLLITGEQGTAKSTTARLVAELVDPGPALLRTPPKDARDWMVTAAASWVVVLDNVSRIPAWLSDALCRAATGEGFARRRLYTDLDISVQSFKRSIILTGIEPGPLSGDLVDRAVILELEPIDPRRRLSEIRIRKTFEKDAPRLLGSLLDLMAGALSELSNVELESTPRMADYAHLLVALDRRYDVGAHAAYLRVVRDSTERMVDLDPAATAIRAFVAEVGAWTGTTSELLDALEARLGSRPEWMKSVQVLSSRMRRAAPALRAADVAVEFRRAPGGSRRRLIHLASGLPFEVSRASHPRDTRDTLSEEPPTRSEARS